jgi:hypothetical protein
LNGTTYQSSNTFSGLAPNDYTLYVRNSADATCVTISSSPITMCLFLLRFQRHQLRFSLLVLHHQEQSITTQSGVEYSVNGTAYQSSNSFAGLAPGSYTLYVRNLADPSCVTMSGSTTTINSIPPPCSDNCECYSAYMCCAIWQY